MKVLAIDTSTDVRVAVGRDGDVVARAVIEQARQHVEQLMPLVARALTEAQLSVGDLDLIAVGLGPGPFTGLRVGIVTAQLLASVNRIPLRGVCSLDIVAVHAAGQFAGEFVVASDARRKELYWARYSSAGVRLDGPQVSAPDLVPDLPVVGPGAQVYPQVHRGRDPLGPESVEVGVLAARPDAFADAGTEPLYLRRPDATEPGRRKSALAGRGPRPRTRGVR